MRVVTALFFAVFASSAHAADEGAHKQSAYRFAEAVMSFAQKSGATLACAPDRALFGAELKREYLAHPGSFNGISPQSMYWPDIEELYYQHRSVTCPISRAMVQTFADLMVREVSAEDMDAALAFYASPAGQHVIAGMAKVGKLSSAASQVPSPQQVAADLAYRTGLRELMAKYKNDPR